MTEPDSDRRDSAAEARAADEPSIAPRPDLPPAARRALEEAEARRRAAQGRDLPPELGGPKGLEPTRYGDWEAKGIAVDF